MGHTLINDKIRCAEAYSGKMPFHSEFTECISYRLRLKVYYRRLDSGEEVPQCWHIEKLKTKFLKFP